jgi:EmrB/QacA subfamily drug resistance transporter
VSFSNKSLSVDRASQTAGLTQRVHSTAVLMVVSVGTLLTAMSGSAVNLALPHLGREFQISIELSRWVVQAFLLAVGMLLLVVGRLSDSVGHRRIYLVGFTTVGGTAIGCALAPSFAWLVAFRLLQGVGGAMVMASSPALLTTSFPAIQRGRVLGVQATATYVGLTIGPPLGGLIVAWLGWRGIFYLMVPISALIIALGLWALPKTTRQATRSKFDWPGTVTLTFGLPLVLTAISEGPLWGWSHWRLWLCVVVGLVSLIAFVRVERDSPRPLLDLSLFRSTVFVGAVLSATANYVALFMVILLLPFFLQESLNLNAVRTGVVLSVQTAIMALVASPAGWLSDRFGSRGLAVTGLSILSLGLLGLSFSIDGCTDLVVALWLGVIGLGTGIFISPNSSALMGSAPRQQQGVAGAVLAEARILGMLIGVVIGSAVFQVAGGRTGNAWRPEDLVALRYALWTAAAIAFAGTIIAGIGNRRDSSLKRIILSRL